MAKTWAQVTEVKAALAKLAVKAHKPNAKGVCSTCVALCKLDAAQRLDKGSIGWTAKTPQRQGVREARKALCKHTGVSPVTEAYKVAEYAPAYRPRGNASA